MRILGLDLGEKRVGVAVSDELGYTAQGVSVLDRKPHAGFMEELAKIVREYGCEKIVMGLPKNMDGSLGPQAHRVLSMAQEIKKHIYIEVETWDERMSTMAAERALLEADMRRSKRKQVVDKVAAALILQGYLDSLSFHHPETQ